jgi:hypothetical protein
MSTKYKYKKSRDNWKRKTINYGKTSRYQKKEITRIKKDRDRYKKEARETKKQLDKLNKELQKNKQPVNNKEDTIYLVLQLFLNARIGFRAVHRVLNVLGSYLGLEKIPCTQTIINWVNRLSIARIQNCIQLGDPQIENDPSSSGFILMIDTSIGLGSGKILAVLSLNINHHIRNEGAPKLQNTNCVAVAVSASWTGEAIADFLQKVIAIIGRPVAYLKDGGKDLAKAVRILSERDCLSLSIDDISHVIANLLKHEYQNHPMFEIFTSACGKVSKKLKQTVLACLAPPKVTMKARFMNLHRLVSWADKLLKHSPTGRAPKGSILSKLRASLDQIPKCKAFISRFLRDANPLLECQKILKNKGLSQDSYSECQQQIEAIPARSHVLKGFTNWAEKQLMVAEKLGLEKVGMPICSDSIESLFGVSKHHGTGEIKDANRIAMRIPSMCGELTEIDVQKVLSISVKEQRQILDMLPSLTKQRRQILPNPGNLEKIKSDESKKNLELIPESKKWSKKLKKVNNSEAYKKVVGPMIDPEKQAGPPLNVGNYRLYLDRNV